MPTGYKERTDLKKGQSVPHKTWKERLRKCILSIRPRSLLTALAAFVLFTLGILGMLYMNHPCQIKDANKLASSSAEKVLEEDYKDDADVKRGQVIQIIYDVLYGLRVENCKEPMDAEAIIRWAKANEILVGRVEGFCEDDPATKEESLMFLGRSLGIMDGIYAKEKVNSLNESLFHEWSSSQIKGLVIQEHLRVSDIDELGDLQQLITVSELEGLLNQVAENRTQYVGFGEFSWSWITNNPIWAALMALPSILTVVCFLMQIYDRLKQSDEKAEENANRTCRIYLAGISKTGKSTLKKQIKTPGRWTGKPEPTEEEKEEEFVLRSSGRVVLKGTILDGPGDSPEHVLKFLDEIDGRNGILLLVLAHKKTSKGRRKDSEFIKKQLDIIKNFWVKIISQRGARLNKVVVFFNKTDLLSPESLPAEERIYKKHMNLLGSAADQAGVPIYVAEGSSTHSETLSELYNHLIPDPPDSK